MTIVLKYLKMKIDEIKTRNEYKVIEPYLKYFQFSEVFNRNKESLKEVQSIINRITITIISVI